MSTVYSNIYLHQDIKYEIVKVLLSISSSKNRKLCYHIHILHHYRFPCFFVHLYDAAAVSVIGIA